MRTAILLPGQIRNAKQCHKSIIEHVVKPYLADVFIESWLPNNYTLDHRKQLIPNDMSTDELLREYKPKLATFENFDSSELVSTLSKIEINNRKAFDGSWAHETIIPNIFYMYYKVWLCYESVLRYEKLNNVQYECIVRLRFDLEFEEFPLMTNLKPNTIYVPSGSDHRGGLNDLVAIGDRESMSRYCNTYLNLMQYARSGIGFHPESILRHHIMSSSINIERFNIKYKLRGQYI